MANSAGPRTAPRSNGSNSQSKTFEKKALMDAHTHNDAFFRREWHGEEEGEERGGCDDDDGVAEAIGFDRETAGGCLHFDLERRAGNMVVAPFHQQDIVATLANQIVYLVLVAAGMLDEHLVARSLRSINANE